MTVMAFVKGHIVWNHSTVHGSSFVTAATELMTAVGIGWGFSWVAWASDYSRFTRRGVTERYPDMVRRIVADGHEVGWHGYLHELPHELPVDEQRAIIERAAEVLEPLTGARPVGYRAPWWQLSLESPELLAAAGFAYDSSLMDDDVPYLLASDAGTLVELPVHWSFDDWEQYGFFVDPPLGDSLEPPSKLLEIWRGELEAMHEEGCLQVLTMHPFLSGRPARARTIGKFVSFARELGGVWFAPAGEIAAHARTLLDEAHARRLRSALDPEYEEPGRLVSSS
jgi:peptidoglycan-N-acetylglucosamine deacetylase